MKLGRTPSWVSERLKELREEIHLQNGVFPPPTDAERGALRDSIREYGVITPVLVDEDLRVICGNNRLLITLELGYPCPMLVLPGLDVEEKRTIAVTDNATRRQLSRQQRRKLVEHELMHDSARSDRRVAAICGVHHSTVASIRAEMVASSASWRELELPLGDGPVSPVVAPEWVDSPSGQLVWLREASVPSAELEAIPSVPSAAPVAAAVVEHSHRVDSSGRLQPARKSVAGPRERLVCRTPMPFDVIAGELVEVWKVGGEYEVRRV